MFAYLIVLMMVGVVVCLFILWPIPMLVALALLVSAACFVIAAVTRQQQ